jgi:hypothetical protein
MKLKIGMSILGLSLIVIISNHYFINDPNLNKLLCFSSAILAIAGLILVIPFDKIPQYIFDNHEYDENRTVQELVNKIRLRAILFNNISVVIFFFTILVIFTGFYLLVFPPLGDTKNADFLSTSLTVRIGASILLIFLVQILFKVFKYLLRVAAFYHAKADAIEFHIMKPELELEKLMELFTPDKYDISDLQQSSVSDNLIKMVKTKLSK